MRHSTHRILVSHAGNLPRPEYLNELIDGGSNLEESTGTDYQQRLPQAVRHIVEEQVRLGVDIVNDGEFAKGGSYGGYMVDRVTGYSVEPADSNKAARVCTSAVSYTGQAAVLADVANLKAAIQGKDVEGYVAALGPLSLGAGVRNEHYSNEEEYMMAVAEACREEYKVITDAGLIVQVDEPEFCTSWTFYPEWSVDDLRKYLSFSVEVINHSIAGLPEDLIRFHTCWGSGHRPHVNDIELKHIADLLIKINARQYSIEAANVRHEHEYHVWENLKLPEGKMLMPGVISHATDLVEHPELVAERLVNYANLVGQENVQTGTDCGIGSRVGHEEIVWAKLWTMAEGARLASEKLWS